MSDSIISIENLSKRYMIGRHVAKGDGLRHALEGVLRAPFAMLKGNKGSSNSKTEEFWALKDVNLEIKQGEMLGIIGRNGAGKSTMLKLLSRITEPTTGRIHLRGRVASLLEVGTGFHPELTGRENIFLNGSILGMTRLEIKRRFDEIVEFSEIGKFLDTPVKRYSSGMYVRLAFAVAAHLEPEILIVDEVLAVGDAEFQKKCLGKMEDVSTNQGRTVIIVSHQMQVIQNLCTRCVLMNRGRLVKDGKTDDIVADYLATGAELADCDLVERTDRQGKGKAIITGVEMLDPGGKPMREAISGNDVTLRVSYSVKSPTPLRNSLICLTFYKDLECYFGLSTRMASNEELVIEGEGHVDFRVPAWPLAGGRSRFDVYLESGLEVQDVVSDAGHIYTVDGDFFGSGMTCHDDFWRNYVLVPHMWTHQSGGSSAASKVAYAPKPVLVSS
jgi:lipopolysaccharide transport system ATP-binding protein